MISSEKKYYGPRPLCAHLSKKLLICANVYNFNEHKKLTILADFYLNVGVFCARDYILLYTN